MVYPLRKSKAPYKTKQGITKGTYIKMSAHPTWDSTAYKSQKAEAIEYPLTDEQINKM